MDNNGQIKPIEEEPKKEINTSNVKLNIKETPSKIIDKLPEWSIEPPLEINRGK